MQFWVNPITVYAIIRVVDKRCTTDFTTPADDMRFTPDNPLMGNPASKHCRMMGMGGLQAVPIISVTAISELEIQEGRLLAQIDDGDKSQ